MMHREATDDPFVTRLSLGGDGLRVAIKDTIDIAGYPTRAGSLALADALPAVRHAEVVQRVLDAGCRIVGKAKLHELAFGVTGINDVDGTPLNPNFPLLVPGGSSSGSAVAVAAGLADFALGTDTGGSVRTPAACCGVYGFKPTFGRVSRAGVMPSHSTLDCVGVFAATPELVVQAMTIIDPAFEPHHGERRLTLGVVSVSCEDEIGRAVESWVARSGAPHRSVTLPGMTEAFDAGLAVINAENWAALHPLLDSGRVGADVAARIRAGESVTKKDLARAEDVRQRFRATVNALLDDYDALVMPTMPVFPPQLEDARRDRSGVNLSAFVRPFNLSGHPALSLPMRLGPGRIAALQLVGRMHGDAQLLACASSFAQT